MSILGVKNLKKSFGDNEVLKGVSFSLEKGEVLSIIGSSGGGKTTLLRCLNFLEKPDSGEITVGNEKVFFVDEDGKVFIYYASSDTRMHVATSTVDRLVDYCLHTEPDGLTTGETVKRLNRLIDRNL